MNSRFQSIGVRVAVATFLLAFLLVSASIAIVQTRGRSLVAEESRKLVEESGNNAVAALLARGNEIASLTRDISSLAAAMPRDEALVEAVLPAVVDFHGDHGINGGGWWPSRFGFHPDEERHSFFWARDRSRGEVLVRSRDFDTSKMGYHNEEWFVPARHMKRGRCYWSQVYVWEGQPMVTCAVARFQGDTFLGVGTVDQRLQDLQSFTEAWSARSDGYMFIVDRDNRFITWPHSGEVQREQIDASGSTTLRFIDVAEFAAERPGFEPLAQALQAANARLLDAARQQLGASYSRKVESIDSASYQIDRAQAELVTAIAADPFAGRYSLENSTLSDQARLDDDPLLDGASVASVFMVPNSYWKLVIVRPLSATVATANQIAWFLTWTLAGAALVVAVVAYLLLQQGVVRPLRQLGTVMERVAALIASRRYIELKRHKLGVRRRDELGLLANNFDELLNRVVENEGALATVNQELERKVDLRTAELSQTLDRLKASQAQLVQSEKMASLGQMVAGVAHEINTPLGYVKNNLLIAQDLTGQLLDCHSKTAALVSMLDDPGASQGDLDRVAVEMQGAIAGLGGVDLKEDLTSIYADSLFGLEQIGELVVNLRNFSRLDEARVKDVQLHECIESALTIARNVLKNKVDVVRQFSELPPVACSPAQINQVLLNLFTNAAHAIDERGILTVSTRQAGNRVVVGVRDTGRGIPSDVLPRIFDPFFTTKRIGEGTGLGLSIAYQIIHAHGGTIHVESTVGVGTVFEIELPTQPRTMTQQSPILAMEAP